MIYKWIGKLVVVQGARHARRRFGAQLLFIAGFAAVALTIGIILAARQVREG